MRTYYIYKATNKVNGKLYIGQTVNYHARGSTTFKVLTKRGLLISQSN